MNFENKYIERMDVHYSRIIESWHNAWVEMKKSKPRNDYKLFRKWLSIVEIYGEKLTEEEIRDITFMYRCGKVELEIQAKEFLRKEVEES